MFAIPEQLLQATKAAIDEQLFAWANCAQATFDGGVSVVDLNVDAVKASMAAAAVASNQLLAVKDGCDWVSLTTGQSQQALERASAYARQAAELANAVHQRFSMLAQGKPSFAEEPNIATAVVIKKAQIRALPEKTLSKIALNEAAEGYDLPVRAGKITTTDVVVATGASVTRSQA